MVATLLTLCCLLVDPPEAKKDSAKNEGPLGPGQHALTVKASDWEWPVELVVPKQYDPQRPVPLVVFLHGAGGDGPTYLAKCGWKEKADEETFAVAVPTAPPPRPARAPNLITNPRIWNSGQLRPFLPRGRIDDLAFIRQLLVDVFRRVRIDPDRVYIVGHSNGAGMAFRVGAEMSESFAAVAAVSGYCFVDEPKPTTPRPTLYLVGTDDPLSPLEGGGVRPPWGITREVPSVARNLAQVARGLGCADEPETLSDKDGVKKILFKPTKKNGAPLEAWIIAGQGHNWPGGEAFAPGVISEVVLGPMSNSVKATDVIWDFFKKHRR